MKPTLVLPVELACLTRNSPLNRLFFRKEKKDDLGEGRTLDLAINSRTP